MILARALVLLGLLLTAPAAAAAPPPPHRPGEVEVVLDTAMGKIVVAVDTRRAPITANNFLRYVDGNKFDGTFFYRAARSKTRPGIGLIQGGIDQNVRNSYFPIAHEPTSKTGLRHIDGTLSMARNKPGTAMGDFFICVGPAPSLDADRGYAGYAAFGHVVSGMEIVRKILTLPTYPGGYSFDTMGQSIINRVPIKSARRLH